MFDSRIAEQTGGVSPAHDRSRTAKSSVPACAAPRHLPLMRCRRHAASPADKRRTLVSLLIQRSPLPWSFFFAAGFRCCFLLSSFFAFSATFPAAFIARDLGVLLLLPSDQLPATASNRFSFLNLAQLVLVIPRQVFLAVDFLIRCLFRCLLPSLPSVSPFFSGGFLCGSTFRNLGGTRFTHLAALSVSPAQPSPAQLCRCRLTLAAAAPRLQPDGGAQESWFGPPEAMSSASMTANWRVRWVNGTSEYIAACGLFLHDLCACETGARRAGVLGDGGVLVHSRAGHAKFAEPAGPMTMFASAFLMKITSVTSS